MVGAVSSYTITQNLLSALPRNWIHSAYFQDDWKVLPNLTLNLGVRYQVQSAENNKYGQVSSFDPNGADNVVPGGNGLIIHPKDTVQEGLEQFPASRRPGLDVPQQFRNSRRLRRLHRG